MISKKMFYIKFITTCKECKTSIRVKLTYFSVYAQCGLYRPCSLNEAIPSKQKYFYVFLPLISLPVIILVFNDASCICLSLPGFLLHRVPYGVIHLVTVRTLWRPFILLDESWYGLLQMGLGNPTCVRV